MPSSPPQWKYIESLVSDFSRQSTNVPSLEFLERNIPSKAEVDLKSAVDLEEIIL